MRLSAKEKNNMQRLTSSTERVAGRGRKDLSSKILKRHYFFMVLDYCFKVQSSFLVAATAKLRKCVHRVKCSYMTCNTSSSSPRKHQQSRMPVWKREDPNYTILLNSSEQGQPGVSTQLLEMMDDTF